MQDCLRKYRRVPIHSQKIKHFDEPVRERFLDHSEYVRFDQVLTALENERTFSIYGIAAIRVLILTGARKSEIERLRWNSIDLAAGKIRVVLRIICIRIKTAFEFSTGNLQYIN